MGICENTVQNVLDISTRLEIIPLKPLFIAPLKQEGEPEAQEITLANNWFLKLCYVENWTILY